MNAAVRLRRLLQGNEKTFAAKKPPEIRRLFFIIGITDYAFSSARVRVVRSQTSDGPKYWIAPG